MEKCLCIIADDVEKYLMQLEHDIKFGHMTYKVAVGAVVGIVSYAKNIICDIAYYSKCSPSLVERLLDRLDVTQMNTNARLYDMEYSE